jgi:GT2 family glycosyltransferase
MGEMRMALVTHFCRKTGGKRLLGTSWRRWENNIITDLKGRESEGVIWIQLILDRFHLQTFMNLSVA